MTNVLLTPRAKAMNMCGLKPHIEAWVSELAVSATLPLVFCISICSLHKRIASLVCIHIVPRRHISLLFCLPFLLLFSSFSSYTPFSPASPFSSSFFSFHPLLFLFEVTILQSHELLSCCPFTFQCGAIYQTSDCLLPRLFYLPKGQM